MNRTIRVAFCGVAAALEIVLLFLTNLVPTATIALPALAGVLLLVSGGVAYTAGIIFYRSKKRYMHFIWHLFVLAGSVLHYLCVALYCV